MASRIQGKTLCLGKAKQVDIATIAASFITITQLNPAIASPNLTLESDKDWIGKGHEFATTKFPVSFNPSDTIENYGSTEFTTWAWSYALGTVGQTGVGPFDYTVTPLDPGTSLELPYLSIVEQVPEGGGKSVDDAYRGCAIEEVTNEITFGAGLQTHKCTARWVGSGLLTSPSGVTPPALTVQKQQVSQSLTATINGTDYVGNKNILSATIGWKNNIDLNIGLFPGSGVQNGAGVRGRLFIGNRVPTFSFRALLTATSPEYTALVNQTSGAATLKISNDTNDWTQWAFTKITYNSVVNGNSNGLVDVTVTAEPEYNAGVLTFTSSCAVGGIAQ